MASRLIIHEDLQPKPRKPALPSAAKPKSATSSTQAVAAKMAKSVKSATAVPDPKENVNPTAASVGAKRAHQDAFGTTAAKQPIKKKKIADDSHELEYQSLLIQNSKLKKIISRIQQEAPQPVAAPKPAFSSFASNGAIEEDSFMMATPSSSSSSSASSITSSSSLPSVSLADSVDFSSSVPATPGTIGAQLWRTSVIGPSPATKRAVANLCLTEAQRQLQQQTAQLEFRRQLELDRQQAQQLEQQKLQDELQELQQQRDVLQRQVKVWEAREEHWQAEIDGLVKQVEEQKALHEKQRLMESEAHQLTLDQTRQLHESLLAQSRQNLAILQKDLKEKTEYAAKLREELDGFQAENEEKRKVTEAKIERLTTIVKRLSQKLDKKVAKLAVLKPELVSVKSVNAELSILYQSAKTTIEQMEIEKKKESVLKQLLEEQKLEQEQDLQRQQQTLEQQKAHCRTIIDQHTALVFSNELLVQRMGEQRGKYVGMLQELHAQLDESRTNHELDNQKWREVMNSIGKQQEDLMESMKKAVDKIRSLQITLQEESEAKQRLQAELDQIRQSQGIPQQEETAQVDETTKEVENAVEEEDSLHTSTIDESMEDVAGSSDIEIEELEDEDDEKSDEDW